MVDATALARRPTELTARAVVPGAGHAIHADGELTGVAVGRHAGTGTEAWSPFVFFELDGRTWLHAGARAFPRSEG